MADELKGKKIAALVDHGFEQSELLEPKKALEQAGAEVHVVSPQNGEVKGWQHTDWGEKVKVDRGLSSARAADYDGLLLPGGVMNPDQLRVEPPGSGVREVSSSPRTSRLRRSATARGRSSRPARSAVVG